MGPVPVRVLIADDEVLLRDGLARLLEDAGLEVVARAGDADDLLRKARAHKPDVAIVDVRMPPGRGEDGLLAAEELRRTMPEMGVLLLSVHLSERYARVLLDQGRAGAGYLLKDRVADVDAFVAAVRRVAGGGTALDPEVVARLVGRRRSSDPLAALTDRERAVLELMAEGLSNRGIAERLSVSPAAIEKHVTQIFTKLGLVKAPAEHRRVRAVLTALQQSAG
jgi:DNA-binding NarL/FixJ family response regulator